MFKDSPFVENKQFFAEENRFYQNWSCSSQKSDSTDKKLCLNSTDDEIMHSIPTKTLTDIQKQFIVLSGYKACTEEALRYLVEEEGLSREDPLVVGLERHLHSHEMNLEYYQLQRKQFFETALQCDANDDSINPCDMDKYNNCDRPLSYYIGCPLFQRPKVEQQASTDSYMNESFDESSISPTPSI